MWENIGCVCANSVAMTDASVLADRVWEVA